jgi:uncharacterized integral membrane protein
VSQVIVLLALAFSILIAIFAVQNTTAVAVQFLTFRAEAVAVSVLVLISALLGALAILFFGLSREVSLRFKQRSVSQQLKQAQARIAELEAAAPPKTPIPSVAASSQQPAAVSDAPPSP